MDQEREEYGSLWINVSAKGERYMTGTIGGVRVVIFTNKNKRGKAPDLRVYKSEPKPETARPEPEPERDDLGW